MGERQVYFLRMLVAKDLICNFSLRKYNSWSLVIFISRLSWFPLLKSNIVVIRDIIAYVCSQSKAMF